MGLSLTQRVRAGVGTFEEWKRAREADIARAGANINARADQLVRAAIRNGQEITAKTPSDVREFVKAAAAVGVPGAVAIATANQINRPSGASTPSTRRSPGPSAQPRPSRTEQLLDNARRLQAEARRAAKVAVEGIAEDGTVRRIAGDGARTVGNVAGVVTGTAQMAKDVVDATILGKRLTDPSFDRLVSPGRPAWEEVAGVWSEGATLAHRVVTDPHRVVRDVKAKAGQVRRELDPTATLAAPTFAGEVRRQFEIGQNQGELLAQVAPYAVGAGEAATAAKLATTTKAARTARHIKQGFTPAQAEYLAEPYPRKRMGHHSVFRRNAQFPDWMGGGPVPRSIVDSEFSVVKPPGASRGETYELHGRLDSQFRNANFPPRIGGSWTAAQAGIRPYSLLPRLWFGTPNATKRVIAAGGVAPDLMPLDDYDGPALDVR